MGELLLDLRDLRTQYRTDGGVVRAVDGVSLSICAGETVGLVGESACGKSAMALSILGLIEPGEGCVAGGEVRWRGTDLRRLGPRGMRRIRGREIAMIFQDPFASLNPVFTVGAQIGEAVRLHRGAGRRRAREIALEALARVGIPDPGARLEEYPHRLSGGMQQRVMIAMALACSPRMLIADEPTTALDVTVQAQILDLLSEVQKSTGMALLLITHDLGVVSEMADRVAVMYAGRIVEEGPAAALLSSPRHPYTRALLDSIPRLGARRRRLKVIGGNVPDPLDFPPGCRFHPRCGIAERICRERDPALRAVGEGRRSACHFAERMGGRGGHSP